LISKYLSELGITEDRFPHNWGLADERQKEWEQQREEHGFDVRETWSLDMAFYLWVYPRLKMFDEVNIIDTEAEEVIIDNIKYTFQECINIMLEGWKIILTDGDYPWFKKEDKEKIDKILLANKIFGHVLPMLWW